MLALIDDIVLGAPSEGLYRDALTALCNRLDAVGARLSLEKSVFLTDTASWCGVEIDLRSSSYRVDPARVSSLREHLTRPADRKGLQHILGVLRYYVWGVHDAPTMRSNLSVLSSLDKQGVDLSTE